MDCCGLGHVVAPPPWVWSTQLVSVGAMLAGNAGPRGSTAAAQTAETTAAALAILRNSISGEEFFLVSDGKVEVIRADHEVARLGPGNFFGEVALISGEPRNATVVAESEVDAYLLGKSDFETALATSQSLRDQLYRVYFMRH